MTNNDFLKLAEQCGLHCFTDEHKIRTIAFAKAIEQKATEKACAEILAGMLDIKNQSLLNEFYKLSDNACKSQRKTEEPQS